MKRRNQLSAGVLALSMLVSLLPATASAAAGNVKTTDGMMLFDIGTERLDAVTPPSQQQLMEAAINTNGMDGKNADGLWRSVAQLAYASKFDPGTGNYGSLFDKNNVYMGIDGDASICGIGGGNLDNNAKEDFDPVVYAYSAQSKATYAANMANAYDAMRTQIFNASNANGGNYSDMSKVVASLDGISNKTDSGPVLFSWEGGFVPKDTSAYMDGHYVALAVLYSNFKLTPTLETEDIAAINLKTSSGTPTNSDTNYVSGTSNAASVPTEVKQTLAQNVEQSVSKSLTKSQNYSFGENLSISNSVSAQVSGVFATVATSFTTTAGVSAEQAFGKSETEIKESLKATQSGSEVSLTLLAQTEVMLSQSLKEQTATVTYDCPVKVTYDVTILCLACGPNGSDQTPQASVLCKFKSGDAQRGTGSFPARFLQTKSGDEEQIDWEQGIQTMYWYAEENAGEKYFRSERARKALNTLGLEQSTNQSQFTAAKKNNVYSANTRQGTTLYQRMSTYRPCSYTGGELSYKCTGVGNDVYEITPMFPLNEIVVTGERNYSLQTGDVLYADTIGLEGYNANQVAFYGFHKKYGTWELVDENGAPADASVAVLGKETLTGYPILTANGAGTVYLKYTVSPDAYQKLDIDTQQKQAFVTENLTSAYVPVKISTAPEGETQYDVRASGALAVLINDTVNLNGCSEISGAAYNPTSGEKVSNAVSWRAEDLAEDGITIDSSNNMSITKAGTYRIHAYYQGCYSDWITVTAEKSSDTSLKSLSIDGNDIPQPMTEYSRTVDNVVEKLQITAEANDRGTVSVNGGGADETVNLAIGENIIHVTVTAEDGTQQSYPLTITRERTKHRITASAGTGGTISPDGDSSVFDGDSLTYTITPEEAYTIEDVMVDGVSVGAVDSYLFKNVTDVHTISASFLRQYTVTASADAHSSISPAGASLVSSGGSIAYTIAADDGYMIADVLADGVSVGAVDSYLFKNVQSDHQLSVSTIKTYTLTAHAGSGGAVSPEGTITLAAGTSKTYRFAANDGYVIHDVQINGNSIGAVPGYTFENISGNQTIAVSFLPVYALTATAEKNGTVTPAGEKKISLGGTQTYVITPESDYAIADVLVDGVSIGARDSYTFENVTENHTISAQFKKIVWNNPFRDVSEKDWFYPYAQYVQENGLMNGIGSDTFAPYEAMTRGMLVTVLYRIEGSPTVSGSSFSDVPAGAWYSNAVAWAQQNNIVKGYEDATFRPENKITREQIVTVLYRYCGSKGYDLTARDSLSSFTDQAAVSKYARTAMQWAVGSHLMNGKGDNLLEPQGIASRAEVAALLARMCTQFT